MQVEMNRRRALAGLATIPVAAGMVALPEGSRSNEHDYPRSLREWLLTYDKRCDGPPQEMCEQVAEMERDANMEDTETDWRTKAYVNAFLWAWFDDGNAIVLLYGFLASASRARALHHSLAGAMATAGIPIIGSGRSWDNRAFAILTHSEVANLRAAVDDRLAKHGVSWVYTLEEQTERDQRLRRV